LDGPCEEDMTIDERGTTCFFSKKKVAVTQASCTNRKAFWVNAGHEMFLAVVFFCAGWKEGADGQRTVL